MDEGRGAGLMMKRSSIIAVVESIEMGFSDWFLQKQFFCSGVAAQHLHISGGKRFPFGSLYSTTILDMSWAYLSVGFGCTAWQISQGYIMPKSGL